MPTNYNRILQENRTKYGTEIDNIGRMLMSGLYADRTQFIFEMLQNAEDALARREKREERRSVEFSLSANALTFAHFGKPFDEADVRGVCGIGESSKDLIDVGKFGIGFKSVYAYTDSPEIHSGSEHFAIDSYTWPREIPGVSLPPGGTVIRLPFNGDSQTAVGEILENFQKLDLGTLLFLREIEEISWSAPEGKSGQLLRRSEAIGRSVRKVSLTRQCHDAASNHTPEEQWLIFSRRVSNDGKEAGSVEVAFALAGGTDGAGLSVRPVSITDSPLVVFFPTILSTNLGFLVQGPFRTTPSRDNVPARDPWNQHLIYETSVLLVDALQELRQLGLLNVSALRCLPLNASLFPEDSMFAPMFSAVRDALKTKPLLPRYKGGHVAAQGAKLARSQGLRDLISTEELNEFFESDRVLHWLSEDITPARTRDIHDYLTKVLAIDEVTPGGLVQMLTKEFLEARSDEWIERLYSFLRVQQSLLSRLGDVPLIRLEDGTHVVANGGDRPTVFLPGSEPTGFPTARANVCKSESARAFLESLGLRVADLVDDVIVNVLPRYSMEGPVVTDAQYQIDIKRILRGFETDSTELRKRLVSSLKNSRFIRALDADDGSIHFVRPAEAYQANRRMKELFAGVHGVLIVDDSLNYLRGKPIRALLESVGAPSKLTPRLKVKNVSWQTPEMRELRKNHNRGGGSDKGEVHSYEIKDLKPLLKTIANLPQDEVSGRSALLWKALCGVDPKVFRKEYRWHHYNKEQKVVLDGDSELARLLNETSWVADDNGELNRPKEVVFENTGWEPNSALQDHIRFKKPVISPIDGFARELGIDPDLIPLLVQSGVTSREQFRALLHQAGRVADGDGDHDTPSIEHSLHGLKDAALRPNSTLAEPKEPTFSPDPDGAAIVVKSGEMSDQAVADSAAEAATVVGITNASPPKGNSPRGNGKGTYSGNRQKFNSYVPANPGGQEDRDPDGLKHQERLNLEEKAIKFVLAREPGLERTRKNNPGYDLVERGVDGQAVKRVEVKAMKGTLRDRPITVTRTQFEHARKHRDNYWVYVVQKAGDPAQAHVLGIQDPFGKTRTLTFDEGWSAVAEDMESHWVDVNPAESGKQSAQAANAETDAA